MKQQGQNETKRTKVQQRSQMISKTHQFHPIKYDHKTYSIK